MNLEDKLRQLKRTSRPRSRDQELERTLDYLRRLEKPIRSLPAQRVPKGVEEYVDGRIEGNAGGEFFLARQSLPFGRPYGKMRIGDLATEDLSPLGLFLRDLPVPPPSKFVYLDTETTGLVGGTGTCAFLIGIGAAEGNHFVVRQFFLRDYPDEKAALAALSETLEAYQCLVTFNGKTFDIPLLETRYSLARMKSPFDRLVHLDLLHPARRLWKLRLESCELQRLEVGVLGLSREGDIPGSDIPGLYFDYLRTGDAGGLQPVFYHNALDIVTLAALTVRLAQAVAAGAADQAASSLDLFSLSRIFDRAGATERAVSTCRHALAAGLPTPVESRALWHLACQYKRQRQFPQAAEIWREIARREEDLAIQALEELAIYHEHRRRDCSAALQFVEEAIRSLQETATAGFKPARALQPHIQRFAHRLQRLQRKVSRETNPSCPPLARS